MKTDIQRALQAALQALHPQLETVTVELERCRDPRHGDWASNVALKYAKSTGEKPRDLAQKILERLEKPAGVAALEVAGAGFINVRLAGDANRDLLQAITEQGEAYGRQSHPEAKSILLEFVSANPNGPLHVGHGRGAAYGASLANVLRAAGHRVDCEYYVNDAGRQMDILALSVYWRYLQLLGLNEALPAGVYQGDYVRDIARGLLAEQGTRLQHDLSAFVADFANDEAQRDAWIDACIARLRALLGEADYALLFQAGLKAELADIQSDLAEFGVHYQRYYSEASLFRSGQIESALEALRAREALYLRDGAWWFKSQAYGDEKDRVVQRENGITTYFASDIAYHDEKLRRGYDWAVNIWGADHHGYIARVKAALSALGHDPERLRVLLVQFAVLYRGGEKMQMSTRSGQFVTLRELRQQVGNGACRFFYVMRKADQHLDFDLDLASSNSKDNPYYYVQYAHARCCRVLERARDAHPEWRAEEALAHTALLQDEAEQAILQELSRYAEVLRQAAEHWAPHRLIHYLKDLAAAWHRYYDAGHKVLHEDEALRSARLLLTRATAQILRNALQLVGVDALERM